MRGNAVHTAVALALIGLSAPAPVHAVELEQSANIESLAATVAALPETPVPAVEAPQAAEEQAEATPEHRFEPAGVGQASYYGAELAGNRTATGERFNPEALTAAHRTLPLGTTLRVTNQSNGKSVIVRINDRGPFAKSRIIDVSLGAARKIQMVRSGTARVKLEIVRSVA